jgi:ribosomal protein S12 methylthiotransferase
MNSEPKLCHYLDIPVQHISDPVLQAMRRNITREQTLQLLREIRRRVPGIALRTTLLVGHPGETEDDFRQLLDFVQEMRFERLGVFTYSHEEGTHAGLNYRDDIPSDVKAERAARIMELQRAISEDHNQRRVGSVFRVLIDRQEGDFFVGRTQYDSPEVDNEVLIPVDPGTRVGSFCDVRITSATEYDLFGALVS